MEDGTLVGQPNAKQAQPVVAVREDGVMVGTPTAHCTTLFRLTFWGLERWRLIGVQPPNWTRHPIATLSGAYMQSSSCHSGAASISNA